MTTKVPVELVSLDGGIVINESSADADFRVESNDNANMLFVDGGNNVVTVGGATFESADTFCVRESGANSVNTRFVNTNADANGVHLILAKSSSSPADNDELAQISFFGQDDAGNANTFAALQVYADDVSNGTEDGIMAFGVASSGTYSEAMRIAPNGDLCVGTTSAEHTNADIGASVHISSARASGGTDVSLHLIPDHGEFALYAYNEYFAFLDLDQNSERFRITQNGDLLLGTTSIDGNSQRFQVSLNSNNKFNGAFITDGNNANRFGPMIRCGTDDNSGTNTMLTFQDGDGTGIGTITSSGGTVTYGAFTAHHEVNVPDEDNPSDDSDAYPYGTLVEVTSVYLTEANKRQSIRYTVQKSQSANSKKVLGAYSSNMRPSPMCPKTGTYANNLHNISILGDGHILCNNSGGNIEVGDGICTSAVEGIGMKATANPSMIVGIAQEDVTFSGTETKLVAVQFGVQQFTPWS